MAVAPDVVDPEIDTDVGDEKQPDNSGPRLRCPLCGWVPGRNDRWACNCGHWWNTFDTGGACPDCLYQWTTTHSVQCVTAGRRIRIGTSTRKPRTRQYNTGMTVTGWNGTGTLGVRAGCPNAAHHFKRNWAAKVRIQIGDEFHD